MARLMKHIELDSKTLDGFANQGECVTFCYNMAEVWANRSDAFEFFREAAWASEGCERERYMNILLDLMSGKHLCFDGSTTYLTQETEYR